MTGKIFNYTNDIGESKKIVIGKLTDEGYYVSLWSNRTGDLCGHGYITKEKLFDYLKHYNIKY